MQYLTKSERDLYSRVTAALVGATAKRVLADGPGTAHLIADASMHQVRELRTRERAARLRKQRVRR